MLFKLTEASKSGSGMKMNDGSINEIKMYLEYRGHFLFIAALPNNFLFSKMIRVLLTADIIQIGSYKTSRNLEILLLLLLCADNQYRLRKLLSQWFYLMLITSWICNPNGQINLIFYSYYLIWQQMSCNDLNEIIFVYLARLGTISA